MKKMVNPYTRRGNPKNEDNLMEYDEGSCCDDPCVKYTDGDAVCLNCGMVVGKALVGNEKRAYTIEEINERKHTAPRWREFGPRTLITNARKDSKGQTMDPKGKTLFTRLSKIQNSLISSIERNLWEAKPKLNLTTSKMNIPEHIKETAWRIYTEVAKKKLTMGRSIDGFIAASLYAAIRIHEFPRLLEDVCDASLTPRHTVIRSLGLVIKEILPEMKLKYRPITIDQLVFMFGNNLEFPMDVQKRALNFISKARAKGLSCIGKDPKGIAASALYIAAKNSDVRKTQAEISDVARITEVTLRSRVKDIKKRL
ncbi:MAG: hypothetical protein GF383_06695 [Candidatus Lokiarchaeota archaeon]|nr:hypothetical protein [Candidatus Lokiarchaeota archaeon]MBD3339805.1 hypothetical protein [Candidatus Lokiarchaeota archaeon]